VADVVHRGRHAARRQGDRAGRRGAEWARAMVRVRHAVRRQGGRGYALEYAAETLRADREFVLAAVALEECTLDWTAAGLWGCAQTRRSYCRAQWTRAAVRSSGAARGQGGRAGGCRAEWTRTAVRSVTASATCSSVSPLAQHAALSGCNRVGFFGEGVRTIIVALLADIIELVGDAAWLPDIITGRHDATTYHQPKA
jgi:hypothetical protein